VAGDEKRREKVAIQPRLIRTNCRDDERNARHRDYGVDRYRKTLLPHWSDSMLNRQASSCPL
jgi:hypothetical protein